MPVKAIIYDLDNTIYPVSSIGDELFAPIFSLIKDCGKHDTDFDDIKKAIMRTPFRLVAQRYNFSDELTQQCISVQENTEYTGQIAPFEDYTAIKTIPAERFLVTTGFKNMQQSKIARMGIAHDFREVHIVDPTKTSKKEVFADILNRYGYDIKEILVIGDDPESEIAAAKSLGIPTVLYDKNNSQDAAGADYKIESFHELTEVLENYSKK